MKKIIFYACLMVFGKGIEANAQDYWLGGAQPTFTVTTTTTGNCTVGGDHFVVGNSVITGAMAISGTGTIAGNVTLSSDVNIGGMLAVSSAAIFSNTLSVAGDAVFGGALSIANDASVGGTFEVASDAIINGRAIVESGIVNLDVSADATPRTISGHTITQQLAILARSTVSNGSNILLWGTGAATLPGGISYLSTGTTDAGHVFGHIDASSVVTTNLTVGLYGQMLRGPVIAGNGTSLANIVAGDVLTVKDRLGFYSPSDANWRDIHGNTETAGLSIFSKTNVTDGNSIIMHGIYDTLSGLAGAIEYSTISEDDKGHLFKGWGHNGRTTYATISRYGSIFGPGTSINDILGGDVVTVQSQLGFFDATDANWRAIHGNTQAGGLSISSTHGKIDGSSIEMYGPTNGSANDAGSIHYSSYGTSAFGHVFSNNDGSANHDNVVILNDGRTVVGQDVNTTMISSNDVLTVKDAIGFYNVYDTTWRTLHGNTEEGVLGIAAYTGSNNGSSIEMYGRSYSDVSRRGTISFSSYGNATIGHGFSNFDPSTSTWTSLMAIQNDGKVIVGKDIIGNTPGDYFLYVEKGILTEKLRVANHSDAYWADFVFNKNYTLMSIDEVEKYIKVNKHLPEIPSANEVKKNGVDVLEMEGKLLQKIEELTLYVIKQQKEIDALRKKINK